MVSLKIQVISTFLMVFMTIDKTYSRNCINIMTEYFPVSELGIEPIVYDYHRYIFHNLVYDEVTHFEVKAYMKFLSQGIDHLNSETQLPKEFCKNSENSKTCRKQLENCGFTSDNARDNFLYAYFNLSIDILGAQKYAIEYMTYLFDEVTFYDQITSDGRNPWEYCQKIDKCSNSIKKNLPEAKSCQTIDELFNHIYENIKYKDIQDSDTRKYVDFIFKFAENGVSKYAQLPTQFCDNSHELKNDGSKEVCINELDSFEFEGLNNVFNVVNAYYNLTLKTIQFKVFAESYFNYLRSQISINYSAFADGFSPRTHCLKVTYNG